MSYRPMGQPSRFDEGGGPQSPEVYSLIDRHSAIEGTFTSDRDVRIEGSLRGNIRCQGLLYIAEGADVDATVEAANIAVAGNLRGSVACRGKLQIMPTGRVVATVMTDSLVINEGAIYEGQLTMGNETAISGAPSDVLPPEEAPQPILRRFTTETETGLPAPKSRRQAEE